MAGRSRVGSLACPAPYAASPAPSPGGAEWAPGCRLQPRARGPAQLGSRPARASLRPPPSAAPPCSRADAAWAAGGDVRYGGRWLPGLGLANLRDAARLCPPAPGEPPGRAGLSWGVGAHEDKDAEDQATLLGRGSCGLISFCKRPRAGGRWSSVRGGVGVSGNLGRLDLGVRWSRVRLEGGGRVSAFAEFTESAWCRTGSCMRAARGQD